MNKAVSKKLRKLRLAYLRACGNDARAVREVRPQVKGEKQASGVKASDRWSALLSLTKFNQQMLVKEAKKL